MKKLMTLAAVAVFCLGMSAKEPVKCCCNAGENTECKCKNCKCSKDKDYCDDCKYCKDNCKGGCCHDSKKSTPCHKERKGGCCEHC